MQPGWHADPYGRFARRYHDGQAWTEHVADDQGAQRVDPVGASAGGAGPWSQPSVSSPGWQAPPSPAAAAPPASASPPGFAPPGFGVTGPPVATPTQAYPVQATTLAGATAGGAPAPARAERRGVGWVGVILALAGAALVAVGLFGLDWLSLDDETSNRSQISGLLDDIDAQGGSPSIFSTTFFAWGWIVTLVVAGVVVLATLVLRAGGRILAAVLALVALAWVLFGWLNLRAYLNNDFNNDALGFGGESFGPEIGGWITVAGFGLLALGALLGGPLAARRRS